MTLAPALPGEPWVCTNGGLPVDRNAQCTRHGAERQLRLGAGDVVHAVHEGHEDVVRRFSRLARDCEVKERKKEGTRAKKKRTKQNNRRNKTIFYFYGDKKKT